MSEHQDRYAPFRLDAEISPAEMLAGGFVDGSDSIADGAAPQDTHDLVPGTVIGAIVYRGKAEPLPYMFDDEDRDADAIMALVENLLTEYKALAGVSEAYVDTTYRQPMLALVGRAACGREIEGAG